MQIYTFFMFLANKCHTKVEISVKKTTIFMVYYLLFSNFYQKGWYDFDKDKKTRRQEDKKSRSQEDTTIVILTAYLRQQQNE